MARTILAQSMQQDEDLLDYYYQKCCENGEACLNSRKDVEELLKSTLDFANLTYIIVDGLDECERTERKSIVQWFRNYVDDQPTLDKEGAGPDRVHCLFVSQVDHARGDFKGLPAVTVAAENNEADIEEYSKTELEKLRMNFKIPDDRVATIIPSITAAADGKSFVFLCTNTRCMVG